MTLQKRIKEIKSRRKKGKIREKYRLRVRGKFFEKGNVYRKGSEKKNISFSNVVKIIQFH